MNFLIAVLNVALFGFTCIVISEDGVPMDAIYFLFTVFLLLVSVMNLVMIYLGARRKGWFGFDLKGKIPEGQSENNDQYTSGRIMKAAAWAGNIALVFLSCLAYIDQYPHPKEDGLVVFILLLFLTPVLSMLVILRNGAKILQDDMK